MSSDETVAALEAVAATEIDRMKRLAELGNRGTAGPETTPSDPAEAPVLSTAALFTDGWWCGASHAPAHPGRVGGPITAWSTVVHTTDMCPEDYLALVTHWRTMPGDGACAHFLIGRSAAEGVLQLVPIVRNGNHAGGPQHGVYVDATGRTYHPNTVAIGIEIHCAGAVRLVGGAWHLVEDGKAHGASIPAEDVIPDPQRPGRGWHVVTPYQYTQLAALLADLDAAQPPMPVGAATRSLFEAPAPWSALPSARVTGHHDLDARNRDDPHRPTFDWLRAHLRPAPTATPGGGVPRSR
jgi:N-acetyl-anhydromuramyl-L-alanine amidase AmpD